jgi:hypothetical protein
MADIISIIISMILGNQPRLFLIIEKPVAIIWVVISSFKWNNLYFCLFYINSNVMAENQKEISRLLSSKGVRSVFGLSILEIYNEVDLRKKYRKSALLVVSISNLYVCIYIHIKTCLYTHVYIWTNV